MEFKGLYTVLITPFHPHGALDEEGYRQNIRYQLAQGVQGFVALGTTGESPTLTEDEQEKMIKIARAETSGKAHLVIGAGNYSTAETVQNALKAQELGADVLMVITPYYNKPTQEGLYQHYKAIADAVKLPIIVYNNPPRTSLNMLTPTLKRLAQHKNIAGVKEASGSINQIMEVIDELKKERPGFKVFSGDDQLTYPLMTLGGDGVFSVVSNLLPKEILEFVNALSKGDYNKARTLHYKYLPLMKAAFIETNPIPIKAMMDVVGMAAGTCRLPLCDLQPTNLEYIKKLLAGYNIKHNERSLV
jgi:4-hydroxy-tetrahydrodipicolinate synthase